jgi:SpoVK/Ycf46/Vps4 family AAA+-type ATPase
VLAATNQPESLDSLSLSLSLPLSLSPSLLHSLPLSYSAPGGEVIVLAATNQPEALDAALRRPGRFDRTVSVSNPALAGRQQVLGVV